MRLPIRELRLLATLMLAACAPTVAPVSSAASSGWALTWSDEFDGAAAAPIDTTRWVAESGGEGWGNHEREFYTGRAENVSLDGAGHLVITARAEPRDTPYRCWYGSCLYSSARIATKGKFQQTYGRFESRIRIPRGHGLWPAFWMLGSDIDGIGWPKSGEIDVMENIGREPTVVHGTVHGPGYSGAGGITSSDTLAVALADDFHVYAVEWSPNQIRWLIDEREYHRITPADIPAGARWVFDHPFFLLLNVAVGGDWPADPDASTIFPQRMQVDYVRVYSRR